MKELADKANVSRTAVSMILNGKTNGHISRENQERVLALVREHNFRPNMAARRLRTGKLNSIGVMMPVPCTTFYADMATLLQRKLSARGYSALFSFFYSSVPAEIEQAFRSIAENGVSSIISWEYSESFAKEKIPAVLFSLSDLDKNHIDQVIPDVNLMVDQALAHLLQQQHERIAVMGMLNDPRIRLFHQKLSERGLPIADNHFIDTMMPDNMLNQKVEQLINMNPTPTAIVCHDDLIAARIHSQLLSLGKNIPNDFSILCFNDSAMLSVLTPAVSAFSLQEEELSDMLIQLLVDRIENPQKTCETKMISPELIIRKSTQK